MGCKITLNLSMCQVTAEMFLAHIIAYFKKNVSRLERARVSDAFGQDLDLDAPLSDGDVIKCII